MRFAVVPLALLLVALVSGCTSANPEAVALMSSPPVSTEAPAVQSAPPGIDYAWSGGCTGLEGTKFHNWHWCGHDGLLTVRNHTDKDRPTTIQMMLITNRAQFDVMTIKSPKFNIELNVTAHGMPFMKEILVPARGQYAIQFHTNAPRLTGVSDPRMLVFTSVARWI